jgi:hypothetical protein
MSFGYSVGDFIAIGQLTWSVYKSCREAPGEFQELARQLSSLHTTLHELEDDANSPTSLLNRRGADRKSELEALLGNLSTTLSQLDDIVKRYRSLGSLQKKTWDRVKFATKDLADLRSKLQIHITSINLFVSSLSAGSLARIESLLDDLVRDIKAGRKEPTVLSAQDDDDELSWVELERELVGDGIRREDVKYYRDDIRIYLRRLVENVVDELDPSDSISMANNPEGLNVWFRKRASQDTIPAYMYQLSLVNNPDPGESLEIAPTSSEAIAGVIALDSKTFPTNASIYLSMASSLENGFVPLHLSQYNLEERQAIVFMATRSEEDHKKFGIPYQPFSTWEASFVAWKIAMSKETFDYSVYGKLGNANIPRRISSWKRYRTKAQTLLRNLPSFNVNSLRLMHQLVARVIVIFKQLGIEYIEMDCGFRCRGYNAKTEFLVIFCETSFVSVNQIGIAVTNMTETAYTGPERVAIYDRLKNSLAEDPIS